MSLEAMKQALEALYDIDATGVPVGHIDLVINALRTAIAEAEVEAGDNGSPIKDGWQLSVTKGHSGYGVYAHMEEYPEDGAFFVLSIAEAEKQEPVAWMYEVATVVRDGVGARWESRMTTYAPQVPQGMIRNTMPLYTAPPAAQRQPLIDLVRQMRDVQGMDGTWNCDPYMHGLYNGLEFAVSLLEQREPQFKDAPEKWLSDLPKPRIISATEAVHGITGDQHG